MDQVTGIETTGPRRVVGRRAVVTGASRGIGAGIAERLAAEGASVAIVARRAEPGGKLVGSLRDTAAPIAAAGGGTVATVVADLTDPDARARIVPEATAALGGPIDILVNNAAAAIYEPLATISLRRRRLMFEANVHAPLDLAQAVIPAMVEAGEGWIVNITSRAARHWVGPPFGLGITGTTIAEYGASKAALDRIGNGLGAELLDHGIRVNSIAPRAAVMSEGAEALVGGRVDPDKIESLEHMVEAVVALCCCAREVTGRTTISHDVLAETDLAVRSLDARSLMQTTSASSARSIDEELSDVERSLERLFRLSMGRRTLSRQSVAVGASVSRAGYAVLRTLDDQSPLSMGELASRTHMDPAVAARQVGVLEEDGLVRRSAHGGDGRVRIIERTDNGADVYRRIVAMRTDFISRVLAEWSPPERRRLAEVDDRLVDDLQHQPFVSRQEIYV